MAAVEDVRQHIAIYKPESDTEWEWEERTVEVNNCKIVSKCKTPGRQAGRLM